MNTLANPRLALRSVIAALLALTIAFGTFGAPTIARADTAGQRSTRTLILTGLAAVAAIILYNNYHHKEVAANTVVGYTRDGGTVYADGRIVYPDGTVLYTGNSNRQRCNYMGYGAQCGPQAYAYHGYYGYPNNAPSGYYGGNGYYPQNGYYQPANVRPYNQQPYYAPQYNRPRADRDDRRDRDDQRNRDRDDRKRHRHPNNDDNGNGNGNGGNND